MLPPEIEKRLQNHYGPAWNPAWEAACEIAEDYMDGQHAMAMAESIALVFQPILEGE